MHPITILIALIACASSAFAQTTMPAKPQPPALYRYRLFLPDDYEKDTTKKWPTILFLHGSGERGEDLKRVESHGPHKFFRDGRKLDFILIYPQCPAKLWWNSGTLNKLLDEVSKTHRIDPDRLYLTGLSMGGFGAWDLAITSPQRFAALVPICGAGKPAAVAAIKDLPVWVFHGVKDRAVPVARSYDMIEALARIGGRVRYTLYPDLDHDSWTLSYNNPELYTWLLEQRRGQPKQAPATEVPSFPREQPKAPARPKK